MRTGIGKGQVSLWLDVIPAKEDPNICHPEPGVSQASISKNALLDKVMVRM